MLTFVIHCASPPMMVYVPLRCVHDPDILILFPAMVMDIHVRSSLPVNETVMVFPIFANHELLFDDVIFTNGSVGLVPNDVKCNVSKLHSCWIPVNVLPVQEKLLTSHELASIVPSVSLTTIPFILFVPFIYCAVVKYIVNVAGIFLNADQESVELL